MAVQSVATTDATIPAELTAWVTRLRAGVIVGLFLLLMAGRLLGHLPIPLLPIVAVAIGATLYNGALTAVLRGTREWAAPAGDRIRARVLYVGGFLDTIAMALVVLLTGGLISPWLYFLLATSIVSSAILPPNAGRVLTAINAATAAVVVILSVFEALPFPASSFPANFWWQPGYAVIVMLSLIALMGLTAYAVSVPVESARAAARFQEGLTQLALALQRSTGVEQILTAVCTHAHQWFDADRTAVTLLEGEELVLKAVEGIERPGVVGRRMTVSDPQSLEVDVLRRRSGFYVNQLRRSAYAVYPSVAELDDQAILLVPLLGSLGVLGVLSIADRRRAARFTPTQLERAAILGAQAGSAVENARLLDRVREEADRATALLGASERLTRSQDLPTLLTDINRLAAEAVHADRSTTFLWNVERQVFQFGSTFGNPAPLAAAMQHIEFERGAHPLIEKVLAGESFVLSAQQAAAQLPVDLQHSFRLGASAIVPLTTEHGVQGVMTVSYLDPLRDFGAEQLWTLRGIARYAALAIERARLMAQEREATATAEALVALGRELSATLDRRQVLARIPEMAATAAGCDFAILGFWDRTQQRARILGVHGFSPDLTQQLLQLSLDVAESSFTDAVMGEGYFEIQSPQPLMPDTPDLMGPFQVSSLLCFVFGPVEQRMGSLTVGYRTRTGPFSTGQKRLINGIAQQAAVVLENIRLVDDLRQANRLKSDFLSTVSHELRTPLNAIIGYTDLLHEGALGPLQPEQREVTDIISKKGLQLLELINTTLDLTRLEAGQVQVDISEFALADVLTEIHQELADEVPPQVEFTWRVAADVPRLCTDRLKLKTVIRNLAHNALKFTRRGQVEIRAGLASNGSAVELVVRDTGIGIAAGDLKAIFEMFRQLEAAMTRQFGGVGLGLYIVQRLLELLRGDINVQSEPGRGSVFTVRVPVRFS